MKRFGSFPLALFFLITSTHILFAQELQPQPPVPCREEVTAQITDLRKISTPEGIEVLETVELGSTKQWISIRGLNRNNPVLLFIHGGPGSPTMPISWAFQTPWEDFFTVVQWDQRGVGKNYQMADAKTVAPTLSIDRIVQDAEELVTYLRKRLNKDKIVVMGFSWGTIIGTHLAKKHPEWLYAYVGVGQSVATEDEKYIYDRCLEIARKENNSEAIRELEAIAPYPGEDQDEEALFKKIMTVRKWARVFNGGWYGRPDFKLYFSLPNWAPEYTAADVSTLLIATRWAGENLVDDMAKDNLPDLGYDFKEPIVFFMGRYDLHTPYPAALQYFEKIQAPSKKFVTFERSAHFPMFEEPGRFLMALVNDVLPLTGEQVSFKQLP